MKQIQKLSALILYDSKKIPFVELTITTSENSFDDKGEPIVKSDFISFAIKQSRLKNTISSLITLDEQLTELLP
jgi:hypothetical protein